MRSHLTAINRARPSLPSRFLYKSNLIIGRTLDYGCGHGKDAEHYGWEKYDPYYFPILPIGKFDTIVCNYVLNVIKKENESGVISRIIGLLKKSGTAYITVRRDIKTDYVSQKGTTQRLVEIDYDILFETSSFCTYLIV